MLTLERGTVWFEVAAGPRAPPGLAEIASFAPAPDDPQVKRYLARLLARI